MTNLFKRIKLNFNTLLITAFIVGFLAIEQCDEAIEQDRMDSLEQIIQAHTEVVDEKINELGQSVTTSTVATLDKTALVIGSRWDPELKEIKDRLKANSVKINKLQSTINFTAEAVGEGIAFDPTEIDYNTIDSLFSKHQVQVDTTQDFSVHEFAFEDGFLDLDTKILTKGDITPEDKMFVNYKYSLGEVYVDIYSDPKPFKKDVFKTDISFDNPNMDVSSVSAVVRQYPRVKWVFGPSAGVGMAYVAGKVQPVFNVGISGTLPIIKIYDK